jgi:DNA-binding transcriptional LysR family regulator
MEGCMDRFEAMTILVAAVETGSLSGAGRRLGLPLSTVSRKVSELEAHLKTRLLTRSTRRLALTDAGLSYVGACKRILEEVGEAERAAAGEYSAPKGELILTAPVVFGRLHALPVIAEFLKAYPDIDVRLVLSDRLAHLVEDHIDLAIRIGQLPDSRLVATRIGAVRHVVCASPAYFAARGAPQNPDDLRTHDCVTFDVLSGSSAWTFGTGKTEISIPIHSRLVVSTAEAAIDAAISGVGVTRALSYQIAEATRAGALRVALEAFEPALWPINLVYSGQGLLALKLRAFLDFAAPRLKERLSRSGL